MKRAIKFIETEKTEFEIPIKGIQYENETFSLSKEGIFRLRPPFYWNGATPKVNFIGITWGTPDGALNMATMKPATYYATMVHDALYQSDIPITRRQADECFVYLARRDGFKLWKLYNFFNRTFGGFYRRWNNGIFIRQMKDR